MFMVDNHPNCGNIVSFDYDEAATESMIKLVYSIGHEYDTALNKTEFIKAIGKLLFDAGAISAQVADATYAEMLGGNNHNTDKEKVSSSLAKVRYWENQPKDDYYQQLSTFDVAVDKI